RRLRAIDLRIGVHQALLTTRAKFPTPKNSLTTWADLWQRLHEISMTCPELPQAIPIRREECGPNNHLSHQPEGRLRQEFNLLSPGRRIGGGRAAGAAHRCRSAGIAHPGVLRTRACRAAVTEPD